MALKLNDFERMDIESDKINRSEESEDENISYLPTPASGKTELFKMRTIKIKSISVKFESTYYVMRAMKGWVT